MQSVTTVTCKYNKMIAFIIQDKFSWLSEESQEVRKMGYRITTFKKE